ncbi:polyprenyl synthetase family protein [Clostridium thermarum]|uniref:polyprenyl synthetase family protein n=1 Tax=Clostridium thermarum TaxID=1716543 RepID=UPI0013D24E7E|nr:farnesyl diphosphate synthase [Clostridium thermarum]
MKAQQLKEEIDKWLEQYFQGKGGYNKLIYEAMSYSLSVGGKRIRPLLTMLTYGLYGENYSEVIEVAGAIEMIHTYSLIHDDLPSMDNDDLRRGKPTCHRVYGEAMAILAGDGLLNEAANVLIKHALKHGEKALEAANIILEASGVEGMIGGQVVDILSEDKKVDLDVLNYMHRQKTGALIKAAILAGAIIGGASKEDLGILDSYGEKLGLAFQVKDDILDVIGDTNVLGKKVNSDLENNKTTFITEYGLEECKKICIDLTSECIELLKKLKVNTDDLQQLTNFLLTREY